MTLIIKQMETDVEKQGKARVHYQSWLETYDGILPPRILERHSLDYCERMAFLYPENTLVALVDGEVVGFCSYMPTRDILPNGFINALYVASSHHHQGIGAAMLEGAYQALATYKTIQLMVLADNHAAIAFYEKMGFVFDGVEGTFHGVKDVQMQRRNPLQSRDFRKNLP